MLRRFASPKLDFSSLCLVPRNAFVEGAVDASQDGFERYSCFLPGLDERPVEGGEHEQGASTLLEAFFDPGEVVEVILHRSFYSLAKVVGVPPGG